MIKPNYVDLENLQNAIVKDGLKKQHIQFLGFTFYNSVTRKSKYKVVNKT